MQPRPTGKQYQTSEAGLLHVTPSRLLADHARESSVIQGFGRLQTPKKMPCVTQATGPFTRTARTLRSRRSGVVIRDNERRRETAPKPCKTAETRGQNHILVTLREVH